MTLVSFFQRAAATVGHFFSGTLGKHENVTIQETPANVTPANMREKMAEKIVDFEARRDKNGNIQVYKLPANDGGGSYEVAGINDKYHPDIAAKLKMLIECGKYQEAEKQAALYIAQYTDAAAKWTAISAVEFYLRDSIFNRGQGGAAKIVQIAVEVKVDGGVGPVTLQAIAQAEKNAPQFLKNLRAAREKYEDMVAPNRPNLRAGLVNRWNNALAFSQSLLPK